MTSFVGVAWGLTMGCMAIPATLPPVSGQHRNRALAAARRACAIELATQGLSYQQIADELGYSNRGTVYRLVHNALTLELQEDVENHRRLESERLDALQVPLWEKAMAGDTTAAHQVIQIIRGAMARSRPHQRPGASGLVVPAQRRHHRRSHDIAARSGWR